MVARAVRLRTILDKLDTGIGAKRRDFRG